MYCLEHVGQRAGLKPPASHLDLTSMISRVPILWAYRLRPVCCGWCFLTKPALLPYMSRLQGAHITLSPVWSCREETELVIREVSEMEASAWHWDGLLGLKSCTLVWKQRAPRSRVAGPGGRSATLSGPQNGNAAATRLCAATRQQGQLRGKGKADWGHQEKWKRGQEWGKGVEVRGEGGGQEGRYRMGAGSALRPACPWGRR